eukprot:m.310533 g.310533  ORF g.310533 m.310533 type:complete len:309 (+) comp52308_c0_seq1:280-1206(+)
MKRKVKNSGGEKADSRRPPSEKQEKTEEIRTPYFWSRIVFRFALIILATYIVSSAISKPETLLASAKEKIEKRAFEVSCSKDYSKKYQGCSPTRCGRVIMDGLVDNDEINTLRALVKRGMNLGGSSGGPTILDLHSGALTKGDTFVNVYKLAEAEGLSPIFTSEDQAVYRNVKEKIKRAICDEFGVDPSLLFLTKPTFFSRMTSRSAKTIHDEYWHPHVDKVTYGSFYYTSLLYLNDYGSDFSGGRFKFVDPDGNKTVEPRAGRVSFFTSGSENVHQVEKIKGGTRFALTVAFTCEKQQAISEPKPRQ